MSISVKLRLKYPFAVAAMLLPGILRAQDPALGTWRGYWSRGGDTLRVTMEIQRGDGPDRFRATFSSDRLRVEGIPFSSVEREECCRIRLTLKGDATTSLFEGMIRGDSITGTFTEAGAPGRFGLRREPVGRPGPRSEEVAFTNGGVRLSGTLILPSTAPPFPAVVMMHGSGAEGRFANRFLAHRFAEAGVAALIFDKRGVGQSTGDWQSAGFEDLAGDGAAGIAMLRARKDIRAGRVGLFGHSQGGTILPLVAEVAGGTAFLIASAASGVAPDSTEQFSLRNSAGLSTLVPGDANAANQYIEALVAVAYRGAPRDRMDSLAKTVAWQRWYFAPPPPDNFYWGFSRRIAGYDAPSHWRTVRSPVLLMYGGSDLRVPVDASVIAIRDALRTARRGPPTVCIYPGADHTERLRPAGGVWPRNAPGYLEDLIAWVRRAAEVDPPGSGAQRLTRSCG